MILLQILETRWSKRSRGAPLASRRNATPEALPLPGQALQPAPVFCHRVRFDEEGRFVGKVIEELALEALPKSRASVHFRPSAAELALSFRWSSLVGAPERPHGTTIRLRLGQWCRLLHNGRYGWDNPWSYQGTVINVAFVARPSLDLFTSTPPDATSDHRRDLW